MKTEAAAEAGGSGNPKSKGAKSGSLVAWSLLPSMSVGRMTRDFTANVSDGMTGISAMDTAFVSRKRARNGLNDGCGILKVAFEGGDGNLY